MKDQSSGSKRVRRHHEQGFKDDLIARCMVPGTSVAAIAMQGGINANLLFKWRREHMRAKAVAAPVTSSLVPVCVIDEAAAVSGPPTPVRDDVSHGASPSVIEIDIAGAQLRLCGAVDEAMLGRVLRALRQSE